MLGHLGLLHVCLSALDSDPPENLLAKMLFPGKKMPMYTEVAYHFKSHTWIFGSLIRNPVLDLELDIAFLKFKLNLMYVTVAVFCVSHFFTPLVLFSLLFPLFSQ